MFRWSHTVLRLSHFLQCFITVGLVLRPVEILSPERLVMHPVGRWQQTSFSVCWMLLHKSLVTSRSTTKDGHASCNVSCTRSYTFLSKSVTSTDVCLASKTLLYTLPSSYNITSPQGPRVHLPATYFLFRDITFHLVLALSALLRPKYGTPYRYLFTSANPKHTLPSEVILRRTTFFQPILPPSGPCNVPLFSSETLALYKSLTYLLTYLLQDFAFHKTFPHFWIPHFTSRIPQFWILPVTTSVVRYPRYLDTYCQYLGDDTSIVKVMIYRDIS